MKHLPLASYALVASITLTGCGTAPSLEEQTNLIDYEKCLEIQHSWYLFRLEKNPITNPYYLIDLERELESNDRTIFDLAKDKCEKYRP